MGRVESTIAGVAIATAVALVAIGPAPAVAQGTLNDTVTNRARRATGQGEDRLLVEARELVYDNDRNTVSARGNVEMNYQGRTLQADRVTYDRNTGRVFAEGNARLTEAGGQTVVTGDRFELTEDFKNGFIDSLRVTQQGEDRGRPVTTRFSAPRAERVEGETTVFERGTYTACEPCAKDPQRPPFWQVKAARIIHNNAERTIYYENATLELLGVPVAYVPYFWTPDPTVKRKTGFLTPTYYQSSSLGTGVSIPFFVNLAPNFDLTFRPTYYSRQGLLGEVEWRHRLLTGSYNVRAAGIFQQSPEAFLASPYGAGDREARGSVESAGLFYINERWKFGWDFALLSDKWFLQNYRIRSESLSNLYFRESISTVFLQGQGDRSWFDLRGYYFKGLSSFDWQKQQPVVHPVLDYEKRIDGPQPLGGEIKLEANLTSLTREAAQFESTTKLKSYLFPGTAYSGLYETCAVYERGRCIVRGVSGTNTRLSAQISWRRNLIDDLGQVWTPFAYARADGFYTNPDRAGFVNPQLNNFIGGDDDFSGRVMPAVGVQYRYPFVADAGALGTQTIEPIAQVIARPNEGRIGRLPNDDSHSVIFDDTSIFEWDRFSGYDRVEGGVRADVALKYSITSPEGFHSDVLFGQSYQLAGRNSFQVADLVNAGRESGLETDRSDYVGRFHVAPNKAINFTTRARFDNEDFSVRRFDAALTGSWNPYLPLTTTLIYANYDPQPEIGYTERREGLLANASVKVGGNWSVDGSVLFDLSRYLVDRERFVSAYASDPQNAVYRRTTYGNIASMSLGATYSDECTTFSVVYSAGLKDNVVNGTKERDQTVLFRLELRTLGQTSIRQNIGDAAGSSSDGIAQ